MKKTIIFIAVAFGVSLSVSSQIKFGAKAGLNLSSLSGVKWENDDRGSGVGGIVPGLLVGGYANYTFGDVIGTQIEAVFSMQGGDFAAYSSGHYDSKNRQTLRLNYINIPLLVDIKPFKIPLSFLAGPQFGFCVSRSFEGKNITDEELKEQYRTFDFAIGLGAQYTLIKHLTLGLRYNIGITPSLDYSEDIAGLGSIKAKGNRNNVLQLSAGWTF